MAFPKGDSLQAAPLPPSHRAPSASPDLLEAVGARFGDAAIRINLWLIHILWLFLKKGSKGT